MRTHVATSGDLSLPLPTTTACSPLRWLRPRRYPKQQHLPQRPDVVGQPRRHRWRLGLPPLGRAAAVGGLGLRQGQAQAGMGQTEIIVHMIQGELLAYAVLTFAERTDPSSDRRHMLADGQVEALHDRAIQFSERG